MGTRGLYSWRSQCAGKRSYSRSVAKRVARASQAAVGGRALTTYRCPWCSDEERTRYHVGHPPPSVPRREGPAAP